VKSGDFTRQAAGVWNLVHNAIKFSLEDGRVEIRVERDGDQMNLTVKDNGQRISPDFLPHVFERFRSRTPRPRGQPSASAWACRLPNISSNCTAARSRAECLRANGRDVRRADAHRTAQHRVGGDAGAIAVGHFRQRVCLALLHKTAHAGRLDRVSVVRCFSNEKVAFV
jgi:hypothetical protein